MDRQSSRDNFRRADRLFKDGQFQDALKLLQVLDTAHPNTRNILVPMALCLERLGRLEEAKILAEALMRQFADSRARALAERLRLPRALPAVHVDALIRDHDFADSYDLPDWGPLTTVPVPAQSEERDSRLPLALLCGGCVVLIVALLVLPLLLGADLASEPGAATAVTAERTGAMLGLAALVFAYTWAAGTLTGILGLGALGKLPTNTIGGIVLDVGGTVLVVHLISAVLGLLTAHAGSPLLSLAVVILQLGILLYAFSSNYQLGWGELAAFAVIYFVLSCVLVALPLLAFVGVAGFLAFLPA